MARKVTTAKTMFHNWWLAGVMLFLVVVWTPEIVTSIRSSLNGPDTYMTVRDVSVGNSVVGQIIPMDVDRTIHRNFLGTYNAEVRTFPSRAVVCVASDTVSYDPGAGPLSYIDLDWWANDGECGVDTFLIYGPGDYILTTSWMVDRSEKGLPPVRIGPVDSNPFTVTAIDPAQANQAIQEQSLIKGQIEQLERQIETLTEVD